jgi:FkbM family methyltransferase
MVVLAAKWYEHNFPIQKGKALIYDIARSLVKRYPESFRGMVILSDKGFYWWVEPTKVCRDLLFWNVFSPEESRVVESILSQRDVFIDIGAHGGYFSILASSLVGERGKVLAFEPVPATRKLFRRNVELNRLSNIHLFPYAVSNKAGESVFYFNRKNADLSSLRRIESEATEVIRVKTVAIDQCIEPDMRDRIKLVKIDIEGAELLALEGMRDLLTRENGPDVMCEVTDGFLRDLGGSEETLLTLMKGYGYRVFRIESEGLKPVQAPLGVRQYNALFTKREHISLKE